MDPIIGGAAPTSDDNDEEAAAAAAVCAAGGSRFGGCDVLPFIDGARDEVEGKPTLAFASYGVEETSAAEAACVPFVRRRFAAAAVKRVAMPLVGWMERMRGVGEGGGWPLCAGVFWVRVTVTAPFGGLLCGRCSAVV